MHSLCRINRFLCPVAKDVTVFANRNIASLVKPQNILHLHKRGLLEDIFPEASTKLPDQLMKQQCFYCGFDPTSDGLHIGNLMSLMLLLHCQRAGKLANNILVINFHC